MEVEGRLETQTLLGEIRATVYSRWKQKIEATYLNLHVYVTEFF